MRIIQASYILPLNTAPIKNGYLYIEDDGTVIHVNDVAPITNQFEVEVYEGIVCPGFVNSHCHLELSHMKGLMPTGSGLPKFVSQIPKLRQTSKVDKLKSMKEADQNMYKSGIVAVGDISNTTESLSIKKNSAMRYHSFVELFGLDKNKAEDLLREGLKTVEEYRSFNLSACLVPHAPYSLSPQLLEKIYSNSDDQLLTIHYQETASEKELFLDSKGDLAELFIAKGLDLSSQLKSGLNSAQYALLPYLAKKQKLLLVHNTFSDRTDIEEIETYFSQAYWCTCPKANWYIEKQLPNYNLWREKNLKITIGTDSLASNNSLCVLEEIKMIQKNFPHISTNELLIWACKNGAEFFNYDKLGSFKSGFKPGVLLIENVIGLQLTEKSRVTVLV
ncbi:MAG: metal-dependent hydrolase [Cryomorphaceae bacterium]|nr:MAG: metal-dependent hydrolase [Cryomorphaceae bacterium]